ncbi:MAG: hypothetical protein IJU48_02045 [Synergistaceae bacterium]|nr:hypothetical protein [Synergistaceae bacterium]
MKIDTRYGSIWDELPANYDKSERKIPQTQEEARDFYEAAKSSMHNSLMKTWDAHNESMKQSAKLRQIYSRKKLIEQRELEHREKVHNEFEAQAKKRMETEKL